MSRRLRQFFKEELSTHAVPEFGNSYFGNDTCHRDRWNNRDHYKIQWVIQYCAKAVVQSFFVFLAGTSHRYLFFDLDNLFFCLFNFSIIIMATPHSMSAKSLCCKNHTIPPAIAKIIPRIPIGCSRPTKVVTLD